MKLLIYSHFFAPSIGGVETFAMLLARGLSQVRSGDQADKLDVTLVTQTPAGNFHDANLSFAVVRQPSTLLLQRMIRAADVIHIDGPALAPLFWAWLLRKPVVVEHHVYQAICLNGLLIHQPERSVCPGYFQAKQYRKCVRCYEHETSRLKSVVELLKAWIRSALVHRVAANIAITDHVLKRINLPRAERIYYGVPDSVQMKSLGAREKPAVCFAFAGRFVPEKGIPVLLEAVHILAQKNSDFEIVFIGDGPLRQVLEQIVQERYLGRFVRITGYLSGDALAQEFAKVDVVVMPSVWEETAGLSAIEHMMRGKLVIVSNTGGLGEVVGDAGLRCAPGDPLALATIMRSVIEDPAQIESFGRKARARALQLFQQERMIDEHLLLYERIAR